jgi:hypothetical protein
MPVITFWKALDIGGNRHVGRTRKTLARSYFACRQRLADQPGFLLARRWLRIQHVHNNCDIPKSGPKLALTTFLGSATIE